jgi:hypothetical protein
VTSPIRMEPVRCPSCHHEFETPYRGELNRTLDDWIDHRYAERGCPSLEETVAEAMARPSQPWARWWHRWGPGAERRR